jgi:hypothetical protein
MQFPKEDSLSTLSLSLLYQHVTHFVIFTPIYCNFSGSPRFGFGFYPTTVGTVTCATLSQSSQGWGL